MISFPLHAAVAQAAERLPGPLERQLRVHRNGEPAARDLVEYPGARGLFTVGAVSKTSEPEIETFFR